MTRFFLATLRLLAVPCALSAQQPTGGPPQPTGGNLRVFVDNCPCDTDYLRTEITFIDYMRDRTDAQVHLLFATQATGAGGTAFTMYVIGLREFAGVSDTLTFNTEPGQTQDSTRKVLVRYMKLGLMRYIARTPIADRIQISVAGLAAGTVPTVPPTDPWDFWVFRVSVGGYGEGEKTRKEVSTNGSLSATR